jgi:Low-density lipoprotein receptor repeat class B
MRLAVFVVSLIGVALLGTGAAAAAVYWEDTGGIAAANLDGSSPNYKYFKPPFPSESAGAACGVAVSDSYLYWVGSFAIGRVNLEGPATPATISPHLEQPCGIAIDQNHVYWANPRAGTIGRANLDGTEANLALVGELNHPCGVAVDQEHLYWITSSGIGRAGLDGSHVERVFLPTAPGGCGLAVDARYLYWTSSVGQNERAIGRSTRDGIFRQPGFITGLGWVASIAVDADHVYWTDQPEGMAYGSIGRAGIDGSAVTRAWIQSQRFNLDGVAVDARPTPPPLPLPSHPIHLGKVTHDLKKGTAVLFVSVPERGELTVTSPGIGWKVDKGPPPPPYRAGSFTWRLELWPGKTRFGEKVRKRLRKRGRAVLSLKISYAEEGQLPETVEKRLALLQHRKPAKARRHASLRSR